jgi:hypothetical protein
LAASCSCTLRKFIVDNHRPPLVHDEEGLSADWALLVLFEELLDLLHTFPDLYLFKHLYCDWQFPEGIQDADEKGLLVLRNLGDDVVRWLREVLIIVLFLFDLGKDALIVEWVQLQLLLDLFYHSYEPLVEDVEPFVLDEL